MKQCMQDIEKFLEYKRIAMVGVSRDEKHLSRHVMKAFVERGYEIIPVTPHIDEIEGLRTAPILGAITPLPEAVMVLLSGNKAETPVQEAIDSGVKTIWVYGVSGEKDVLPSVREKLEQSGVEYIAGFCPFMFLEGVEWGHRAHAWIWKVLGKLPKRENALA